MAGFDYAFLQLLFKLLSRQTGKLSKVDFKPQKPRYRSTQIAQPFDRAVPESCGVSSAYIREYLEALAESGEAHPHHVMILRHGKVICECSFAPYRRGMWHITHSMCKSVTGMAVGFAVQEGLLSLDEKLVEIFPQSVKLLAWLNRKEITIENLLNMTSEVEFSEAGAISGNDWKSGYMSASFKAEPGSKFDYNSMNSYMLSAAIQEKAGMTMFEYLKPRLFEPLGIEEIFWEESPEGITKGGWGMFLRPEDACKLGQLYMNEGMWNGTQILPKEWVLTSTSPHSDNGKFGYGYQIWMEERPGGYAFNGLFGQDVVMYPDTDMIIMINSGNRELMQDGSLTEIMRRFWGKNYHPSAEPLPENPEEYEALQSTIASFEKGNVKKLPSPRELLGLAAVPEQQKPILPSELTMALNGRLYEMEKCQVGIFPLICQVMHNNFTDGISKVGFDEMDGNLILLLYEGTDIHHIRIGFDTPATSEILLHGEPYYIGTVGRISADEDGRPVLKLEISFIEDACSRELSMYFAGNELELRAGEMPGNDVIADILDYTGGSEDMVKVPFVKGILESGGMELLEITISSAVHPSVKGYLV